MCLCCLWWWIIYKRNKVPKREYPPSGGRVLSRGTSLVLEQGNQGPKKSPKNAEGLDWLERLGSGPVVLVYLLWSQNFFTSRNWPNYWCCRRTWKLHWNSKTTSLVKYAVSLKKKRNILRKRAELQCCFSVDFF